MKWSGKRKAKTNEKEAKKWIKSAHEFNAANNSVSDVLGGRASTDEINGINNEIAKHRDVDSQIETRMLLKF